MRVDMSASAHEEDRSEGWARPVLQELWWHLERMEDPENDDGRRGFPEVDTKIAVKIRSILIELLCKYRVLGRIIYAHDHWTIEDESGCKSAIQSFAHALRNYSADWMIERGSHVAVAVSYTISVPLLVLKDASCWAIDERDLGVDGLDIDRDILDIAFKLR